LPLLLLPRGGDGDSIDPLRAWPEEDE